MNAQEIVTLIEHPETMDGNTVRQLEQLLEDYPYFQTAHLLYLMNLHALKDSEFNNALKTTACYAGDRRKLFLLINRETFASLDINRLEQDEDLLEMESPFELVDFFLAGKPEQGKGKREHLPERKATTGNLVGLASTDYMTYVFSEDTENPEKSVVPMQHQDAIDDFLRKDAESPIRIELKDNDNKTNKVSREATMDDLETVEIGDSFSETLAKIYVKQKKYDKAIEIIRKLHLVYPEKNIYFADQIRFLEKLIINTQKKE